MGEGEDEAVASWPEIERKVEVARVESPRSGASYYVEEERRIYLVGVERPSNKDEDSSTVKRKRRST